MLNIKEKVYCTNFTFTVIFSCFTVCLFIIAWQVLVLRQLLWRKLRRARVLDVSLFCVSNATRTWLWHGHKWYPNKQDVFKFAKSAVATGFKFCLGSRSGGIEREQLRRPHVKSEQPERGRFSQQQSASIFCGSKWRIAPLRWWKGRFWWHCDYIETRIEWLWQRRLGYLRPDCC